MKKLLILGASELQLAAIIEAKNMGIYTIVADYNDRAVGIPFADKFYNVSTLDYNAIEHIAYKEKIDGIMTICSDKPMPIVARIGEILHLNTISYKSSILATNKGEMRKALLDKGVPIPTFYICKNYSEYLNALKKIKLPLIIKPSDNSGSRGIYLLKNEEETKRAYEYSMMQANNHTILVEEYMLGKELSVEVFVNNDYIDIMQFTDKTTTGDPHFVETGHFQPSELSPNELNNIGHIVKQAVKALEIDTGPAHVEVIFTANGPKIVEVGARLGGDHITTDLVPLSTGINMVKMTIENALKQKISSYERLSAYSLIKYIIGNANNIETFLKTEKIESVISYSIHTDVSKVEINSSNDRNGYYILCNKSREKLLSDLELIEKHL